MLLAAVLLPTMATACSLLGQRGHADATALTINWETTAECRGRIKRYEVQWEHVKYLACADGHGDERSRGVKDNLQVTKAEVRGLHPHSIYQLTIKATTTDRSTVAPVQLQLTTTMAAPETQAREVVGTIAHITKSTLTFIWEDPEDCELQHGQRDGYRVRLEGLEDWDSGLKQLEQSTTVDNSFLAHQLEAFSRYQLTVYNTNRDPKSGQHYRNQENPLILQVS